MISALFFVVAVIVTIAKMRRASFARRVVTPAYILWGETLFYAIGFGLVLTAVLHMFAPDFAARLTGVPATPYDATLGSLEFAVGFGGIMSLWYDYEVRFVVTVVFAVFSFEAAGAWVLQSLQHPGRLGAHPAIWWTTFVLPASLLVLAFLSRDAHERVG